jgi:hypothetical protein
MPSQQLDNLVKIGQIKRESPAQSELDGLLSGARARLKDSENSSLSLESRFDLAYAAAHAMALAALRWHGYRSENRYAVFQTLALTTDLTATQVRVLSDAHNKRNRIAYEGADEVTLAQVDSLVRVAKDLLVTVTKLGPVSAVARKK